MSASDIMYHCVNRDGTLKHEMALECGVIELLATSVPEGDVFGHWDYVSHQVIASPFKPLIYVDKMDIFGYNFVLGVRDKFETVSDYLVIELKKDIADGVCVEQTLRYVEWIKQEYAQGDYSRIKAFLVANDFDQTAIDAQRNSGIRHYTEGGRSPRTAIWKDLTLLRYRFDLLLKKLQIDPL